MTEIQTVLEVVGTPQGFFGTLCAGLALNGVWVALVQQWTRPK